MRSTTYFIIALIAVLSVTLIATATAQQQQAPEQPSFYGPTEELISSKLTQNVLVAEEQQQQQKTYQNPDFGISMQYPGDWVKREENLINNAIVLFHPANDNDTEVNIKILPAPPEQQNMTFDELSNITIRAFKSGTSNQLINYSKTTVDGNKQALKLIYYQFGQRNLYSELLGNAPQTKKVMTIYIFSKENNLAYNIAYFTDISKFDKFLPIAEKMINSIQIKK